MDILKLMYRIMVDIVRKCTGSWWIFYATVQDHGGYFEKMDKLFDMLHQYRIV